MRYRLSPFGRLLIIYIISLCFYYFLESYIEEKKIKQITEECRKNGNYNHIFSCQIINKNDF